MLLGRFLIINEKRLFINYNYSTLLVFENRFAVSLLEALYFINGISFPQVCQSPLKPDFCHFLCKNSERDKLYLKI